MRKFYEKREVLFAVAWIVVYCVVLGTVRGNLGDDSVWMLLALLAMAAGITVFVKRNSLEQKYGIAGLPKDMGKYLYFLPMLLLATGNIWDGFSLSYSGAGLIVSIVSMLLVGYVEEMIFRGFLFRAVLKADGPVPAIIISAVTFGVGHIINLFTGQTSLETVAQIFFAIAWGFIFTLSFYKSGSLIPAIVAHGLIDALSKLGADTPAGDWAFIGATAAVALAYCLCLLRLPTPESLSAKT